jgi:hypothetical protein
MTVGFVAELFLVRTGLRHRKEGRQAADRASQRKNTMSMRQDSKTFAAALPFLCGGAGLFTAALLAGGMALLPPSAAQAKPAYAAATGLPCTKCHTGAPGKASVNDFGKTFAANGHKL